MKRKYRINLKKTFLAFSTIFAVATLAWIGISWLEILSTGALQDVLNGDNFFMVIQSLR